MCAYDIIDNAVFVTELDLESSAQWRKHFTEHDLFIPFWLVAMFLHRCLGLESTQNRKMFDNEALNNILFTIIIIINQGGLDDVSCTNYKKVHI